MPLTPEMIQSLTTLGVQDPAQHYWRRIPGCCTEELLGYVAICCRCQAPAIQAPLVPWTRPDGRRLLVGQCPGCRTIYWQPWTAAGRWVGRSTLPAAPHGTTGGVPRPRADLGHQESAPQGFVT